MRNFKLHEPRIDSYDSHTLALACLILAPLILIATIIPYFEADESPVKILVQPQRRPAAPAPAGLHLVHVANKSQQINQDPFHSVT